MLKIKENITHDELYYCGYRLDLSLPGEVYRKRINTSRLGGGYIYIMNDRSIKYTNVKKTSFTNININDERIHDLTKKGYAEEVK